MSATPSTPGDPGILQQPAPTQQLNRSCESCRGLKVRCLPDPKSPNQCQRCAKAKRTCVFVAPQRRRPRKRTDSRVAQLEREMRQMRSLLKDRFRIDEESSSGSCGSEVEDSEEPDFGTDPQETLSIVPDAPSSASGSFRNMELSPGVPPSSSYSNTLNSGSDAFASATPIPPSYSLEEPSGSDIIDRGLISLEFANELVSFYITELTAFAPMVLLPPHTTAAQLRRSKPMLFLSVIAAAAIAVDDSLAVVLNRELVRLYAERFFINGDKSFELVQALLLMIVFYYPPESPLKLQNYQYTHIAATMALEIGLASKCKIPNNASRKASKRGSYDEHMAEQARAILGCYHLASNVAMKTRRPNLLLFNDWMHECVKHLERSPHMIDRHMATWFELQKIVDQAMASFGLDDTSSTTPLTESRVQVILRWFDNQMQNWKKNVSADMLTVTMTFEYHFTNLAIYELGVGEGYRDPDAIKEQYYVLPAPDDAHQRPKTPLSAIRVDITIKWMNAAQEMLDFFLSCDTDLMRKLPNLIYTRVGVAVMSLLKVYFSVKSGALGEFVSPQSVNIEMYLEAMTRRLTEASGNMKYKIPSRWLYIVGMKARNWYDRFQQRQMQTDVGLAPPPSASPRRSVSPAPIQTAQFSSADSSQPVRTLAMNAEVPQIAVMHPMDGAYGASAATNTMWQADQANQPVYVMNQYAGYRSPVVPTQYPYGEFSQPGVALDPPQPSQPPGPPRTGMELDGWLPDGSICGMPPLPGM
ncbi:hypothetical protein BDV32DRAFT_120734 [Aspergillus pseudonomiae]|uniref:Uncharacterized protein n=1 Tax=Aspergillus pseudonomiae TaxID=1506151 RepID=A0A5N7D1C5_9EURO|nr:uncharacterized protein BDV37DRAFT_259083 [Aspergillus pseudonomiae]KAB8261901.1 hypothetical protein BDV32DRAFT_120734 [Aspergillus pseudonomiae]KAE8399907.1 hypothetical protein BDV37DRAFT_259083 [Aspergillus pseudonomiae]